MPQNQMNVSHNSTRARDVVFHVDLGETNAASEHLDSVTKFFTTVVGRLYPVPARYEGSYPCAVVSGIFQDNYHDPEDEGGDGKVHNEIMLVAHRTWGPFQNDIVHNSKKSRLIVQEEHVHPKGDELLHPALIAEHLQNVPVSETPACIVAVGVSGVSWQYAKEIWSEIITTERAWMASEGEGYMMHPQYMYDDKSGYFSLREMSFNFTWNMGDRFK